MPVVSIFLVPSNCSACLKFWKLVLCGSSVCFRDSEVQLYLVCCCFHLRHAENVLFIPSKCSLKADSINEGLSVIEMRLLMLVHVMWLCGASGTPWFVTCFFGGWLLMPGLNVLVYFFWLTIKHSHKVTNLLVEHGNVQCLLGKNQFGFVFLSDTVWI